MDLIQHFWPIFEVEDWIGGDPVSHTRLYARTAGDLRLWCCVIIAWEDDFIELYVN